MNLALFDFDGTITKKDSFIGFLIYAVGFNKFICGMIKLSPFLLAYKFKIIPNWKAKEYVLMHFFQNWDKSHFNEIASNYSYEKLPLIVQKKALECLNNHQNERSKVVIVSASLENYLSGWCKKCNVELIGTRLELLNNKITGKILGKNCYGLEKVRRITEKYNLDKYETIYAYGDSIGDEEMLEIANEKYINWKKLL